MRLPRSLTFHLFRETQLFLISPGSIKVVLFIANYRANSVVETGLNKALN